MAGADFHSKWGWAMTHEKERMFSIVFFFAHDPGPGEVSSSMGRHFPDTPWDCHICIYAYIGVVDQSISLSRPEGGPGD